VRYKPDPGEISVIVDGMAGFSVVHDKRRLFRVNAGNASVVDIGTEFAVRSYPQDTVALVYVKSGLVEVRPSNSLRRRGIQVGAHQAIAVGAMGSLSEESASELANYEAELDGRLDFQNRTVASIAETLSHWFGVHVVIEGRSLQEKRVTAVYNTPQLNSILDAIAETIGARYRIDGQTVTMSERR
jgi:transmembrane sensor